MLGFAPQPRLRAGSATPRAREGGAKAAAAQCVAPTACLPVMPIADAPFRTLPDLIAEHARQRPGHPALQDEHERLSYAQLDALMDRIASALQRDGVQPGQAIAICAATSVRYAALFMGALRAAVVVAPLAPSATTD